MDVDITKIIEQLSSHELQLKAELDQLTSRAKEIADRLSQIQTAKAALSGKARTDQGRRAKSNTKKISKATTQSEIEGIITKILREKKSAPIAELFGHVKSQLLASGQSRLGLKSIFAKAISSSKFKTDESKNATIA
jgi:hypothetical protein